MKSSDFLQDYAVLESTEKHSAQYTGLVDLEILSGNGDLKTNSFS
jgi:hypothetical protein